MKHFQSPKRKQRAQRLTAAQLVTGPTVRAMGDSHTVTWTWVTAAIRCGGCGESWEQPMYEDGSTWVCPHCLHAAPVAERNRRTA